MGPRARATDRSAGEGGAALPLFALAVVLVAVATVLLTGITERAVARARAQSAADASALAGAAGGRPAAVRTAAANGATVTWIQIEGRRVEVRLVVDGEAAEAHAERVLRLGDD